MKVLHPMRMDARSEAQRLHRAINWVVSAILVAFAIWSIQLNAEGRSLLKQTATMIEATDVKIEGIAQDIQTVSEACKAATIVVPVPTTDTQKTQ